MKERCNKCHKELTKKNQVLLVKLKDGKWYFDNRIPAQEVVCVAWYGKDCAMQVGNVYGR